jgi:hypothetical protein
MRKEFIECESLEYADELAPWASIVEKVEGGFMAFESENEHKMWTNQK